MIISVLQALHCQTVYPEPQSATPQSLAVSVGGQALEGLMAFLVAHRELLPFPKRKWRDFRGEGRRDCTLGTEGRVLTDAQLTGWSKNSGWTQWQAHGVQRCAGGSLMGPMRGRWQHRLITDARVQGPYTSSRRQMHTSVRHTLQGSGVGRAETGSNTNISQWKT